MKTSIRVAAAFTFLAAALNPSHAPAQTMPADTTAQTMRVGLVLSGGGAKGIAHIGMIQALEEEEIPIDCITGTSMGAIVGSLYSIGYSPAEMMQLLASRDFQRWSSGEVATEERTLLLEPEHTPKWASINLRGPGSPGGQGVLSSAFPTRVINPLPMSWAFMQLYAPANATCGGNFDRLMVPFRCVASDIYRHKAVVFADGQLAEAVRASMSYPFVFQPIMVGDTLLYDGGLYDVYPVDVMQRDFKPDRLVGVDVSTPNRPPGLNDLMSQVENMITFDDLPPFPDSTGVNIVFDLERFGLLGWEYAPEIYAIGYKRGKELADSLHRRIPARRTMAEVEATRRAFRERIKPVEFDSLTIAGTTPGRADYLRWLCTLDSRSTMSMDEAKRGFYRAISTGRLRNFVPHALPVEERADAFADTLVINADVEHSIALDLGGYLTSSAGSFIYAGSHYYPMRFGRPIASIEGWAGQTYLAAYGKLLYDLHTRVLSRIGLEALVQKSRMYENEKMFYSLSAPAFLTNSLVMARASWTISPTTNSTFSLAAAYTHPTQRYHTVALNNPELNGRDRVIGNHFTAGARWLWTTLDDDFLPTHGVEARVTASVTAGRRRIEGWDEAYYASSRAYADFTGTFRAYWPLARWMAVGTTVEAYYSTRPLLPEYGASMAQARAYDPMPWSVDIYDPRFRANQWVSPGLHPVFMFGRFQVRLDAYIFCPMRSIEEVVPQRAADLAEARRPGCQYSEWFHNAYFMGELSACMRVPFGAVRAYVDLRTSPVERWHAGVSLGLPLRAPGAD